MRLIKTLCTALLAVPLVLVLLTGCSDPPGGPLPSEPPGYTPPQDDQDIRGAALLAPFKQQLMQALQTAMDKAGPVHAIDVCQLEAPAIAAELSDNDTRMGRSSHKLRNPANAAQPWVAEVIDHYRHHPDDRAPITVALDDQRTGYAEPIIAQPLCLSCHGENLDPEVTERLTQLYPDDQATGFAAGDLRGVFWVEFAAGTL